MQSLRAADETIGHERDSAYAELQAECDSQVRVRGCSLHGHWHGTGMALGRAESLCGPTCTGCGAQRREIERLRELHAIWRQNSDLLLAEQEKTKLLRQTVRALEADIARLHRVATCCSMLQQCCARPCARWHGPQRRFRTLQAPAYATAGSGITPEASLQNGSQHDFNPEWTRDMPNWRGMLRGGYCVRHSPRVPLYSGTLAPPHNVMHQSGARYPHGCCRGV